MIIAATTVTAQRDWSELFPEIPGCARAIRAMVRSDTAVEQTADYGGCGTMTLRREKDLLIKKRKLYTPSYSFPSGWIKVHGYEAFRQSPLCGNDEWIGSLEIFFEKDKTLNLSGYHHGGTAIMEFSEKADYGNFRQVMNKN